MNNATKMLVVAGAIGALLWLLVPSTDPTSFGGASDPNILAGTITHSRVNVASASSTTVLSANSGRQYALLVNNCDYDVYGSFGGTASKGWGFRLNANGGSYEILPSDNLFLGAVSMIASISNGTDYCGVTTLEK